ncbi:MAG: hypothetical protein Q4B82_06485 [Alysiella sp.]|uniref:hypothetical protein n=1 Tax=Alysiella sp. TaxID=1872483 RepID=UPI0026DC4BB3|nr:hypothetical protein [Alysiella sp.]MDO4434209.1 hypothetical protein [Alysiella sp.]
MTTQTPQFDWSAELHKNIVHSLTTSFCLDFLLFQDKKGGDVDTVHKMREYQQGQTDIHVSADFLTALQNPPKYNSHDYHQDTNYIQRGKQDKALQKTGQLVDEYRGKNMALNENRQLDHVISAHEIHHDPIRILANEDGVKLANQDSNFVSTLGYINNRKSKLTAQEFVEKLPEMKKEKQNNILKNQEKLKTLPENSHEKRQLEDKIRKEQQHLADLEQIDTQAMLKKDQQARAVYNQQINWAYYTSSKFIGSAAKDMSAKGFAMGTRQAFGLILAEIWFELKQQIPQIYQKCKINFQLGDFLSDIAQTLKNIWERIKMRFKDLLQTFQDGFIGGLFASITTTIWNAFQTIGGNAIKIIRETWGSLVQAVKLIFFNPNQLSMGDLMREVLRLIGAAASVIVGTMVHTTMTQSLAHIPVDFIRDGLSAFVGALITGVLTMGLTYVLDHSAIMQKVWDFLNQFKSKYEKMADYYQKINAELDRYLLELSKIEFNLNPNELAIFADQLKAMNNECAHGRLLAAEMQKRNLDKPFEPCNPNSTRAWLRGLQNKS